MNSVKKWPTIDHYNYLTCILWNTLWIIIYYMVINNTQKYIYIYCLKPMFTCLRAQQHFKCRHHTTHKRRWYGLHYKCVHNTAANQLTVSYYSSELRTHTTSQHTAIILCTQNNKNWWLAIFKFNLLSFLKQNVTKVCLSVELLNILTIT